MRRLLFTALAAGLLCPSTVFANGRPPATVSVRFQPEDNQHLLLPSTFGLLVSSDGGETFQWVCEDTIGYGGTYDPDYAVAENGDIYSTTFEGLRVSHDGGCTFETISGPFDGQWIGEVEVASDGKVWATTSTGGEPNDVYVSDDGVSFASAGTEHQSAWWKSIRIAPSDPDRVYLTGFKPGLSSPDGGASDPEALLRRSDVGGGAMDDWVELDTGDFAFGSQPQLLIEDISPTDPDLVFARVIQANPPIGDALYRSADAGESWEKVLDLAGPVSAFQIRSDGQTVIVGTVEPCPDEPSDADKGCVRISTDGGQTFEAPQEQPKMACVGERADGTLFACGANWEPDNFAFGRSTDGGQTWEKVLRFNEVSGPLSCPDGTIQNECAATSWPQTCVQIGVCVAPDAGPSAESDGGPGGGGGGGCGCGAGGVPAAGTLVFLLPFVFRRRR